MKVPHMMKGIIAETGESCVMEVNGYWIADRGRKITSYVRVDKKDNRQYSMDRKHNFYIETED